MIVSHDAVSKQVKMSIVVAPTREGVGVPCFCHAERAFPCFKLVDRASRFAQRVSPYLKVWQSKESQQSIRQSYTIHLQWFPAHQRDTCDDYTKVMTDPPHI